MAREYINLRIPKDIQVVLKALADKEQRTQIATLSRVLTFYLDHQAPPRKRHPLDVLPEDGLL